ncbi:MAG: M14 metallopeptidase family protein [Spirosomataceae bacterium]
MKKKVSISLLLLFMGVLTTAFAQVKDDYYFPKGTSYDPKIPTPQQFFGYQVGEWHTNPFETHAYIRKLASMTDRFKVETYGRSFENRELLLVTVTSPENHKNIDKIQKDHLALMDAEQSKKLDVKNMPIVLWMGYTVHGNEQSGAHAAILAAYHLAAAQGEEIENMLKNTVILLDPCMNPDGSNRFTTWVNQNKSKNLVADPNSREFRETWPGGRSNHYWFDLNRDWLHQQLPESKARLAKFYAWMPNILTDHHEMGGNSTFFFQPGIPSRTNPMTPKKNVELTNKIGEFHAEGLDANLSYYYTQENFDDYYYGKGSTLPDANGAVGILFEQGSSRGHLQETVNGDLSFPFTIKNQFIATQTTMKAANAMRVEMLEYMRNFYQEKSTDAVKSYVFGGGNDPVRTWEMINIMQRNKIAVYKVAKSEKLDGKAFNTDDSFVVPTNQPQHRLIKSLFERRTTFEDSAFYDVSAWTLPHSMNVPFAESTTAVQLGAKVERNDFPVGAVVGKGSLAYLVEWDGYFVGRAIYDLLEKGMAVKVAMEPFTTTINGKLKEFGYGTIEIQTQGKDISGLLEELAKRDGLTFYGVNSGLTSAGIDLGSEKFKKVEMPKILMATGPGVDNLSAGEVWHLLDQRMDIPVTMADIDAINRMDLTKYTHVVLANGRYNELSEEKIKRFLSSGGTLVAMGTASEWVVSKKIMNVSLKAQVSNDGPAKRPYASKADYDGAMSTAGTIFETTIDPSHPIAYGYKQDKLRIFKINNLVFEDTKDAYNTPLMFTQKPLVAGYVHPKNEARIKNSPAVVADRVGAGKVVAFTDNPNFRAFWYGTNKLFINSLFFGNLVGSGRFGEEE